MNNSSLCKLTLCTVDEIATFGLFATKSAFRCMTTLLSIGVNHGGRPPNSLILQTRKLAEDFVPTPSPPRERELISPL